MTISNENRVVRHIGNGVTTVFPYTFLIPEGRAVVSVYDTLTGVQTTLSEPAYSITGEDDVNGGTVTYNPGGVPIPNTKWLIIERVMPYTQSLSITNQAGFFPDLLEQQLDRTTMQIQQISEELNRAIVVLPGETPPNATQLVATLNASQTAAAASATAAASSASAATAARDAALSAVPNAFPLTRTAMLALNTSTHTVAYLLEAGRRGQFVWDGSDLSGTLLGASRTSTGVNTGTDVVTDNNHGYETGFAVVVTGTAPGGLANNTLYYVIKVDDNSYKLATTFANAIAGVAFDITASPAGQVTSRRHFDPRQGVYVTPTSNITGAAGAWVRQFDGPIRPEWFGATLVANSQEALQGFFGYPHTDLFLPAGEWRSDGTLYRKTDINLRASGALDFSNSSGQLIIKGSITALAALAANVAKFARVLTFPAGQTIAAGDVIILHNPTNYSFGADRAEYKDGAMFRAHTVTQGANTVVDIYGNAVDAYLAANMNTYRMDGVRAVVDGLLCIASAATQVAPLEIQYGIDCLVRAYRYRGGIYAGLSLKKCFNTAFESNSPRNNSPHVDNEYGIVVVNSQHVSFTGNGPMATRHAISLGGDAIAPNVPTRFVQITGMTLVNKSAEIGAGDAHGNCDYVQYDNVVAMNGLNPGGRNFSARNSTIFTMGGASGYCMYASEIVGGVLTLENLRLISGGTGETTAYIHLIAQGTNGGTTGGMKDDLHVIARNITIEAPGSALGLGMRVQGQDANKKINVFVDGLNIVGASAMLAAVMVDETVKATVLSDGIIVDQVYGPSGMEILRPDSTIAAVPTREMRQGGKVAVECTSGAQLAVAASQSYRYKYSRRPNMVSVTPTSTGADVSQWGGRTLAAMMYDLEAVSCRPAVRSSAETAFSATENVTIAWAVENREI